MSVMGSKLTALTDAVCYPSNTTGGSGISSPSSSESDGFTIIARKRSRAIPSTAAAAATASTGPRTAGHPHQRLALAKLG